MRASWTPEGCAAFVALGIVQSQGLAQSRALLQPIQFSSGSTHDDNRLEKDVSEYIGGIPW